MDQAVIKYYRKLLKEYFPNSGKLENATIFVEAIGQHMLHCNEPGNYMQLYLQVDDQRITDIKYLCSCEPVANVAVEVLCDYVRGKTLEEAANITEEPFYQIIGSNSEEVSIKIKGLLELLHEGIASYTPQ
jgi:NifU-like protein involved in Fe-S cluster formation